MSEKSGNDNDLEVGRAPSQTTSVSKEVAEAAATRIDWSPEEEKKLVRRQVPLLMLFDNLTLSSYLIQVIIAQGSDPYPERHVRLTYTHLQTRLACDATPGPGLFCTST